MLACLPARRPACLSLLLLHGWPLPLHVHPASSLATERSQFASARRCPDHVGSGCLLAPLEVGQGATITAARRHVAATVSALSGEASLGAGQVYAAHARKAELQLQNPRRPPQSRRSPARVHGDIGWVGRLGTGLDGVDLKAGSAGGMPAGPAGPSSGRHVCWLAATASKCTRVP